MPMFTDLEEKLQDFTKKLNNLADRMIVEDGSINDTHTLPLSVNKSKYNLITAQIHLNIARMSWLKNIFSAAFMTDMSDIDAVKTHPSSRGSKKQVRNLSWLNNCSSVRFRTFLFQIFWCSLNINDSAIFFLGFCRVCYGNEEEKYRVLFISWFQSWGTYGASPGHRGTTNIAQSHKSTGLQRKRSHQYVGYTLIITVVFTYWC